MKLNLQKGFFSEIKKEFINFGEFKIDAFKSSSGVEALEVTNSKCSFVFTPFKGQQIWHFKVGGEDISMQTTVKEPKNTSVYLENYGGFLYHCGLISFGKKDFEHPQHGEIPNAEYDSAYIICDEDQKGKYILLGGELNHDTAFIRKYKFCPEIKIYENESIFKINIKIVNMRSYPLEYMYLCHINFKPFEGAKLLYTAKKDLDNIKIYKTDGSEELINYFERLEKDITIMDTVDSKTQCYDPEICFGINYYGDENKRAYTMQYQKEGSCFVSHPTDVLPYGIRWISRTYQEQSMGMVLPATGEHLGYEYAKQNGQIKVLGPNETLEFYIETGYLESYESDALKKKIESI